MLQERFTGCDMVKKHRLVLVMSIISFVLSAVSLYLAIIILGPSDEFFIFSAITAVLGILSLISFLGGGNLSFGCLITSTVVSAVFVLITLGCSIADGDIFVIALIYFCLYTAGAAAVLIKNKKDRNR